MADGNFFSCPGGVTVSFVPATNVYRDAEPGAMELRRRIKDRILHYLHAPRPGHARRGWNDPDALRRHLRKGDVVLVAGDNRTSAIIRYLTQSAWSHAALYVGDELLRRGGPRAEEARRVFGHDAAELLVEALPEGVVVSPIAKYFDFDVRVVRPHGLRREDRDKLLAEALAAIGWRYDVRNVLDLMRELLPLKLLPARFRRAALRFGSGVPTEVICSSLIGSLFQHVRFPILPPAEAPSRLNGVAHEPGRLKRLVFRQRGARYAEGVCRTCHPTLLTPADFDLSPYFEVVKFNVIADGGFDYRRIRWAGEEAPAAVPAPRAPRITLEVQPRPTAGA